MVARRPGVGRLAFLAFLAMAASARAITCEITGAVGVSFGSYDVLDAYPTDSVGSITYQCHNVGQSDMVTIALGAGGATFVPRRMPGSGESLGYNLYLDAARTAVWGDGTGGTSVYGPFRPPNDESVTVVIYGRIPPGEDVAAGGFGAAIAARLDY
jgi:spore coat protein U-like protein